MGLFGKSPDKNPKEMVNDVKFLFHNNKEVSIFLYKNDLITSIFLLFLHKYNHLTFNNNNTQRQYNQTSSSPLNSNLPQNKNWYKLGIQREEEKIKKSLKEAAAKSDKQVCTILAKEIIRSRKAISKIYTSKAHLNSVQMQMKNQLATLRVAGSLQKSTEVMQAMQALVRLPEVAHTMQELSKEMMRAGIIEEMLDETMSGMEDEEEMEEAVQGEVDKVLWELTQGKLGEAPAPPSAVGAPSTSKEPEAPEVDENELDDMQTRLEALRS